MDLLLAQRTLLSAGTFFLIQFLGFSIPIKFYKGNCIMKERMILMKVKHILGFNKTKGLVQTGGGKEGRVIITTGGALRYSKTKILPLWGVTSKGQK